VGGKSKGTGFLLNWLLYLSNTNFGSEISTIFTPSILLFSATELGKVMIRLIMCLSLSYHVISIVFPRLD
jgi:hypothetical protein